MKSTNSGSGFSQFVQVGPIVPECSSGEALGDVPVLNEVEIDPLTGDVFVAGECGRVWRLDATAGTWSELKSQTDAHIRGMSFVASGDGFMAGFRQTETQQSIVRYQ